MKITEEEQAHKAKILDGVGAEIERMLDEYSLEYNLELKYSECEFIKIEKLNLGEPASAPKVYHGNAAQEAFDRDIAAEEQEKHHCDVCDETAWVNLLSVCDKHAAQGYKISKPRIEAAPAVLLDEESSITFISNEMRIHPYTQAGYTIGMLTECTPGMYQHTPWGLFKIIAWPAPWDAEKGCWYWLHE